MHTRLISYLTKFNLLTSKQYGFRPGYSTELALLTLTDKIKGAIDQGFVVGGVFIDLTKAFDTINHKILIHKLESYGITALHFNLYLVISAIALKLFRLMVKFQQLRK